MKIIFPEKFGDVFSCLLMSNFIAEKYVACLIIILFCYIVFVFWELLGCFLNPCDYKIWWKYIYDRSFFKSSIYNLPSHFNMKTYVFISYESESESRSVVSDSLHGLYRPWNSPGQNTGVGSLSLLQGIFPTQGLNPGLPHCRQILYQLSHQGSPSSAIGNY